MPRVAIKKKQYKCSDLTKYIRTELYERDMSQADLGELLKVTQQDISYKLKRNMFTYEELITIFEALNTSDEDILRIMKL